ncbi:MAG: NAD(P)/FAD-dependent oxidoreductase [Candidatus Aenigmarchaeota archaeon]|nr:NAD(P)/FAD-dependent oxidoreductase [Candidatus Aenigmarchaeota archaeon]
MYDVIIVGAGIAGSYLASLLDAGLNVLLLEKHKKTIPKDSGIVSRSFQTLFPDKTLIKTEISDMKLMSPAGLSFFLRNDDPFAFILHRERFGLFLRREARKQATIRYEAVQEIIDHRTHIEVRTNNGVYECKLLVGCDGTNSVVRSFAHIPAPMISVGMMVKTKQRLDGPLRVYFNKHFSPDFFSWIIPQNKEYGLITAHYPEDHCAFFQKTFELPDGMLSAHTIPTGLTRSYADRVLLVGDACGQNKPLTGGGIMFSLRGARCAAQVLNEAYHHNKLEYAHLQTYEQYWKKEFGFEIQKQLMVRKLYRRLSNHDIDQLFLKFGPSISSVRNFDYDHFSAVWRKLPKWELLRFGLVHLHTLW